MRLELTQSEASSSSSDSVPPELCRLPFEIDHDEPDESARSLLHRPVGSSSGSLRANFRGRRLLGSSLALPQPYCAHVLQRQFDDLSGDEPVWLSLSRPSRNLALYRHDCEPSSSDPLARALELLPIANALAGIGENGDTSHEDSNLPQEPATNANVSPSPVAERGNPYKAYPNSDVVELE